jgi:long-chain acyl-CoA synthetase
MVPEIEAEGSQWRMLGIQAKNRLEWVLCHLANMHQSVTTVAFYDTLGPEASRFIIAQTELTSMAVSVEYVKKISQMKIEDASQEINKCVLLKNLIVFEDDIPEEDRALAKQAELNIYTLKEVVEIGRKFKEEGKATKTLPDPDHVYMFSYTSGTTGDPKGVKLTHKMILACGYAVNQRLTDKVNENDSYCSYLPAAHSFEQALFGVAIQEGMKVGFFGGIILKLTDDIALLKPTLFPSVPRLFNRIYGKIMDKFKEAQGLKGMLINIAVDSKLRHLRNGDGVHHFLYDRLVFNKVKNMLGGKVRIMITGSAPIAADVLEFLKVCFCCEICEGYGMTESSAGTCITAPEDPETGHVGGPLQNVKVRLRDIPEMGYLSTNDPPKGEVCLWGPSITKGYFKNPEKTAEAFHGEWLLSGDVGMIYPNGAIKIIDRAKNIFKLSQGEYIAPEKLENVYVQSEWIAQTWVFGDSLRDHIIGIFVCDPDRIKKYCKETGKVMDEALM